MARLIIIAFFFLIACNKEGDNRKGRTPVKEDTTISKRQEPFDLQVRKYEDPKRQTWQDPKLVIDALGDLDDLIIADIGSGTGYFTFQMAVPAKKVIAVDIEQRFLNYIEDRKTEMYDRHLADKIETRHTTPDTPSLQTDEVDVVLIVNTIAFIKDRSQYFSTLNKGMKKNGRVVIVDYKLGEMPVGPGEDAKVNAEEIIRDLKNAGFVVDKVDYKSLQYQYLLKVHKPVR
jgi:SAM-dependent methyltransferase